MSAKINVKSVREKILGASATKKAALSAAESLVNENKDQFLTQYQNHDVTKEIIDGPAALNISKTLGGYGNLFSFIGFPSGSDPVAPVVSMIKSIRFIRSSLKYQKSKSAFTFRVSVPSIQDFGAITKMPWESGRSWLLDIERSISGVGAYLYKKISSSRSGYAIQNDDSSSQASFRRTRYFSFLYQRFLKNLTSGNSRTSK